MRILCCLNRDLASNLALSLLAPDLAGHEVRVALTERVGTPAVDEPIQRRALRAAEQLQPHEFIVPNGIQLLPIANPNSDAGLTSIRAFAPDLILSIRYGAIFKEAVIGIPRLGILNLHSGVLPTYRGVLATFRALMNGDVEIGCTLHYISDASIDTGRIVATSRTAVHPDRSLLWHVLALYPSGVELIRAALRQLEQHGELPAHEHGREKGAYYSYPTALEWDEFTRRGWRIADPSDIQLALSGVKGTVSSQPR